MASEMVERVAAAIYERRYRPIIAHITDPARHRETMHQVLVEEARAAIKAMREATDAMCEVGGLEIIRNDNASMSAFNGAALAWWAMIDAALKP